ncbi:MAG: rhomboid family intramembrane serine protease [Rhodobacteraceae bacterium]|nr:rhomboid family intramembrane serine protease [Paracoccaceae bacterium]
MKIKPILLALAAICIAIELTLSAADMGLVGYPKWRLAAYSLGAFWTALLVGAKPLYGTQPWVMFISYAFLHGGVWHLAGNMMTLMLLGTPLVDRVGQARFLAIYVLSAVGGGIGFAMLSPSFQPMVGASGALFGLAGAWLWLDWSDRRRLMRPLWPVWRACIILVLLNAVLWALLGGLLAWQTHLGGFIAGWIGAATLARFATRPKG